MNKNLLLAFAVLAASTPTARAADVYLAVGPGGQRMFATDGQTWENHVAWGEPKHDQNDLNCAAFFKGTAYVGGGYFSGRLTATRDGKTWSEGVLPKSSPIFGLEVLKDGHGAEMLYAVTLRGQVYKTADGENWTLVGAPQMPSPTHWIRFTKQGNGILLGSGDFGPALAFDPKTEQITVTQMAGQTVKNPGFRSVAYGAGTFVVCGQDGLLAATKDGLAWQNNETHPERGNITSVVWVDDRFIAVAKDHGTLISKDGVEWTSQETKLPSSVLTAGQWVYAKGWPPSKVQCSRDGVKWEPMPNEKSYFVHAVAFGDLAGSGSPPILPGGGEKVTR